MDFDFLGSLLVLAVFGVVVFQALRGAGKQESRAASRSSWAAVAQANGLESIERVGSALERARAHPNAVGKLEGQRFRATSETRSEGSYLSEWNHRYDVTLVELDLKPLLSASVSALSSHARPHARSGDAPLELEDVLALTHQSERDEALLRHPMVLQALFAVSRVGPPTLDSGTLHLEFGRRISGSTLETLVRHLRDLVLALQAVDSGKADVWNV